MSRSVSRFCLFSLCGLVAFGSSKETELRAVELHARQQAGMSWGTEFNLPDASAQSGKREKAQQPFVQDEMVLRPFGILAQPGSAGRIGQQLRIPSVSPQTYVPPPSIIRPIPTRWAAVVLPIPTTWEAKIILVQDGWGIGHPVESAPQHVRFSHGAGKIGLTQR